MAAERKGALAADFLQKQQPLPARGRDEQPVRRFPLRRKIPGGDPSEVIH